MEQRISDSVSVNIEKRKKKQLRLTGDKSVTEFFRSDLMRLNGDKVVRRRVYEEFRKRFYQLPDQEAMRAEIERLEDASRFVARFYNPSLEPEPSCKGPLMTLAALGQTTPHTLMLELFGQQEELWLDVDLVSDALDAIESFVVRRLWVGVPTNQLQRLFYTWAAMMRDEKPKDPGSWLRQQMLAGTKARRWPDDQEFINSLVSQDCYGRRGLKLLLARIEASYGHKEPASLDEVSIEHIIPQRLSADWKKGLDKQQINDLQACKHFLGNLTITAYNSELGNMGFENKLRRYRDSHFQITKMIASFSSFGVEQVTERGKDLAEQALIIWPRGGAFNAASIAFEYPPLIRVFDWFYARSLSVLTLRCSDSSSFSNSKSSSATVR